MEIRITDISDLPRAAEAFIDAMEGRRLFAFYGGMGAGKTTFITEVCRRLGADDDSGSPTFSIVNEYQCADGSPIYHFDFYRLDSPEEALDMGAEDYFYSGNLCLMEWPERVEAILPEETVKVLIEEMPDGSRKLTL